MIELVIGCLLQLATLSTDASATEREAAQIAPPQTTEPAVGGTGAWDDNG